MIHGPWHRLFFLGLYFFCIGVVNLLLPVHPFWLSVCLSCLTVLRTCSAYLVILFPPVGREKVKGSRNNDWLFESSLSEPRLLLLNLSKVYDFGVLNLKVCSLANWRQGVPTRISSPSKILRYLIRDGASRGLLNLHLPEITWRYTEPITSRDSFREYV